MTHDEWLDAAAEDLANEMPGTKESWCRDWLVGFLATRPTPTRAEVERAVEELEKAVNESCESWSDGGIPAARARLLALYAAPEGEDFKVMRVNSHESSVDPTGHPYIKAMLVITSDLSVDQGREFRVADGDRVRIVRVEEGA